MAFFYSQIEIAAFVHERKNLQIVVHRMIMEDEHSYQKQKYSSAATDSSRQEKHVFHIVHYVNDNLSAGHYAMIHPTGTTSYSTKEVFEVD